jgi:hypothetical protein
MPSYPNKTTITTICPEGSEQTDNRWLHWANRLSPKPSIKRNHRFRKDKPPDRESEREYGTDVIHYRSTISFRWIQTLFTMPRPNMIMSTNEPL